MARPHPCAPPAACYTRLTHNSLSEGEHSYQEKLPASSSASPGSVSEVTNTETVSVEMGKRYFGGCKLSLPSILNDCPTKGQDTLTLSPQEPICPICQKQAVTSLLPQVSPAHVDSWVHLCSGSLSICYQLQLQQCQRLLEGLALEEVQSGSHSLIKKKVILKFAFWLDKKKKTVRAPTYIKTGRRLDIRE